MLRFVHKYSLCQHKTVKFTIKCERPSRALWAFQCQNWDCFSSKLKVPFDSGRQAFKTKCAGLNFEFEDLKVKLTKPYNAHVSFLLDAIASPSTHHCQWVSEWVSGSVIDSFRLEIAIASPSFASLFTASLPLQLQTLTFTHYDYYSRPFTQQSRYDCWNTTSCLMDFK